MAAIALTDEKIPLRQMRGHIAGINVSRTLDDNYNAEMCCHEFAGKHAHLILPPRINVRQSGRVQPHVCFGDTAAAAAAAIGREAGKGSAV